MSTFDSISTCISLLLSVISIIATIRIYHSSSKFKQEQARKSNDYKEWNIEFNNNKLRLDQLDKRLSNISTIKPYFYLSTDDTVEQKDGYYYMNVYLHNIGNGPAVQVCVDDNGKGLQGYFIKETDGRFNLVGPPSVSQDAVPKDSITSIRIRSDVKSFNANGVDSGNITFKLRYEDLMNRGFTQTFSFGWFFNMGGNNKLEFSDHIVNHKPKEIKE